MKYPARLALLLLIFLSSYAVASNAQNPWVLTADTQKDYMAPTLANGMIGVRTSSSPLNKEQILLNGVFDKYGTDNVPSFLPALEPLSVDLIIDNQQLTRSKKIQQWQQQLDMQKGMITTDFSFNKVNVKHQLYVLRHLPHNILQTYQFIAADDVDVIVRNTIKTPKELTPTGDSFKVYKRDHVKIPLLVSEATSPSGRTTISAANTYAFDGDAPVISNHNVAKGNNRSEFTINLKKGQTYRFSIISAITSSEHYQDPTNEAERLSIFAGLAGKEQLIAGHEKAWSKLWQGDIEILGDIEAQRDIRFALFNLYSYIRAGTDYSLPPMGLSNIDYYGHIFWDSELWMLPPLMMLQPELARSALEYRFNRLLAAQTNAKAHGFDGAMFPWESDNLGQESTPIWALTGPFEHHITAVIGIAFWNYYLVTQDQQWLSERAYPMLTEVADFWVSRVTENQNGSYNINNVVGADEYAENIDNNAFTNGAAISVLQHAISAAKKLGLKPKPIWEKVASNIVIEKFADGTTKEYTTYDGRIVKQADANLLTFPLGLITDKKIIEQDLNYYTPRFDESGPAMTHSILSIIASKLGQKEKAWRLFQQAYQPNKRPPFGVLAEGAFDNNPYFATAAGGMLQAVLTGFAGLEITESGLIQKTPQLPKHWKKLTIKGVGANKQTIEVK